MNRAQLRWGLPGNVPMPPTKDDNEKGSSDEEDSDSSGSNSDVSSQDDSSDVSDLEKFDEAYTDFSALTKGVDPQTLERDGSCGHGSLLRPCRVLLAVQDHLSGF